MAASDHLQPQQLAMFMTPREIVNTHELNDAAADGVTNKSLMRTKQAENRRYGLDASVAQHGVQRPIPIDHYQEDAFGGKPIVPNGHHRLAAAYHHTPDEYVPVEHYDLNHAVPTEALDDRGPGTWRHHLDTH